jgi:hypothetical protein
LKKPSILSTVFYSEKGVIFQRYFLGITLWLFLAGCGYVIEGSNPVLPNEARTLALLPIQNQTFNAGLETDLSEQLNLLLRANSSVIIAPSGIADLQLNITLLNLKTSSSGLSNEQISSGVKASIQGQAILEDKRTGLKVWEESALEVKLTESVGNETNLVSSFSLSGSIRELIKLFALIIYERLFTTF